MEAKEFSEKALLFFAKSKYADLFGVALVITIAIASGYLSTNLAKYVDWGPITPFIPLGVISVINVGIFNDVYPPDRPPLKHRQRARHY